MNEKKIMNQTIEKMLVHASVRLEFLRYPQVIQTLFWSLALGQVVGYVATALAGVPDPELWTTIISLIFGLFVYLFQAVAVEKEAKAN